MSNATGRPDWLRPINERYLGDELGPVPRTVHAAAVVAGLCALVAAGMTAFYARIAAERAGVENVALALTGVVLFAILALTPIMLVRRGWFRLPLVAGLILGVMAALGLFVAGVPGAGARSQWDPGLIASAAAAFGLVILLRTASASTWLAKRRYQAKLSS